MLRPQCEPNTAHFEYCISASSLGTAASGATCDRLPNLVWHLIDGHEAKAALLLSLLGTFEAKYRQFTEGQGHHDERDSV